MAREQDGRFVAMLAQLRPDAFRRAVRNQRFGLDDLAFITKTVSCDARRLERAQIRTRKNQRRLGLRAPRQLHHFGDSFAAFVCKRAVRIGAPGPPVFGDAMTENI